MSSSPPFPDRRASVRNAVTIPVIYGTPDSMLEGTVVDISAGGVGLTGPKVYPAKAEVVLQFGVVPGKGHLMSIKAIVRHAAGNRMGLEFVNIGAGDHRKVLDTIQQLLARMPQPKKP